jgi:hypothetical protein
MALSLVDFWVVQNIERNTTAAAANSTLPEYVGEANWIAKNLYAQDAAATQTPRSLRGIAALIILGVCCAAGGGAGAIVTLIAWWILESAINRRTRARCAAQAWATVNEKLAKEAAIRDATHQSALARIAP